MRVSDYFRGQRINLATELSPREVERRINDGADSVFMPFASGVIGWARFRLIRLQYRPGWLRNDVAPVLAGHIRADRTGSLIRLRYRAPLPFYLMAATWYPVLALFVIVLSFADWAPGVGIGEKAMVWGVISFFLLLLPCLVLFSLRDADDRLQMMLAFLKEELGANEVAARSL